MSSMLRRAKAVGALTDDEYAAAMAEYAYLSEDIGSRCGVSRMIEMYRVAHL